MDHEADLAGLGESSASPAHPQPIVSNGPELWDQIIAQFPGAIIAGGAVRDFMLGVEPKDIDVFVGCNRYPEPSRTGFETLGADRNSEYEALPSIAVVTRGRMAGYQIDLVGLWFEDEDYSPYRIVQTFDFGISRCWYDGEIHDTPEAASDRCSKHVTCLLGDRRERSAARFARFNERMGGRYAYIEPPPDPFALALAGAQRSELAQPPADARHEPNPSQPKGTP